MACNTRTLKNRKLLLLLLLPDFLVAGTVAKPLIPAPRKFLARLWEALEALLCGMEVNMTTQTQTQTQAQTQAQAKMLAKARKKLRKQQYMAEGKRMEQDELLTHRRKEERVELDTLEFIQAVDRFKRKTLKVFPSWSEILEILRTLGYQKVME